MVLGGVIHQYGFKVAIVGRIKGIEGALESTLSVIDGNDYTDLGLSCFDSHKKSPLMISRGLGDSIRIEGVLAGEEVEESGRSFQNHRHIVNAADTEYAIEHILRA